MNHEILGDDVCGIRAGLPSINASNPSQVTRLATGEVWPLEKTGSNLGRVSTAALAAAGIEIAVHPTLRSRFLNEFGYDIRVAEAPNLSRLGI